MAMGSSLLQLIKLAAANLDDALSQQDSRLCPKSRGPPRPSKNPSTKILDEKKTHTHSFFFSDFVQRAEAPPQGLGSRGPRRCDQNKTGQWQLRSLLLGCDALIAALIGDAEHCTLLLGCDALIAALIGPPTSFVSFGSEGDRWDE